ncbi:hypothetical protein ACEPAI_6582 [Sanghuangporus weigelae]
MPAIRLNKSKTFGKENRIVPQELGANVKIKAMNRQSSVLAIEKEDIVDLSLQSKDQVYFPVTETERDLYRTPDGKKLTSHQWAVYDLTRQIPCGNVTTYKHLCERLHGGSPRSVGSALRRNPFAPYIPCHRVIASDFSLGGFLGEWGTGDKEGSHCSRKVSMLAKEGVKFGKHGKLLDVPKVLWK